MYDLSSITNKVINQQKLESSHYLIWTYIKIYLGILTCVNELQYSSEKYKAIIILRPKNEVERIMLSWGDGLVSEVLAI